jgi:hypothetical protein
MFELDRVATWIVQSQPGSLRWAEGQVPTPHGPLTIRWGRAYGGEFDMEVSAPDGTSGTITVPASGRDTANHGERNKGLAGATEGSPPVPESPARTATDGTSTCPSAIQATTARPLPRIGDGEIAPCYRTYGRGIDRGVPPESRPAFGANSAPSVPPVTFHPLVSPTINESQCCMQSNRETFAGSPGGSVRLSAG